MSANTQQLQLLSALPGVRGLDIVNNVLSMALTLPPEHPTIDLAALHREYACIGADYQDQKFPSVTFHFPLESVKPRATVKVFAAGKMLCPGCASWQGARLRIDTAFQYTRRVFPWIGEAPAIVSNVVGSMTMSFDINLTLLCECIARFHANVYCSCTHDKEFSAIRFHDNDARIMYLIYWTGKVIIANGKKPEDITSAALLLYDTFARCHANNRNIFLEAPEQHDRAPMIDVIAGGSHRHNQRPCGTVPLPAGFFGRPKPLPPAKPRVANDEPPAKRNKP